VDLFSDRCFSYFSQLLDKNYSFSVKDNLIILIDNQINVFALIHPKRSPPHLTSDKIEISKSSINQIDYSSVYIELLQFPYSTDCFNYEEKESDTRYNSKEDCFVKHLERRELLECGCNKRWSYRGLCIRNFKNICDSSAKCNFDAVSQMNSLETIWKRIASMSII
jgi:hypothetical protein